MDKFWQKTTQVEKFLNRYTSLECLGKEHIRDINIKELSQRWSRGKLVADEQIIPTMDEQGIIVIYRNNGKQKYRLTIFPVSINIV